MPIRGPLATLIAVAAAGAAVVTTNVVLTAGPSEVAQPAAALSSAGYDAPTAPQAPARYDGRSAGDEVTVQVTVENGQATAYLCSEDKGIETWVRGTAADGRMQLRGDDGASVEATSDGTAVFGTASAKGRSWPFSAAVVTAPHSAQPSTQPAPAAPQQDSYGGY